MSREYEIETREEEIARIRDGHERELSKTINDLRIELDAARAERDEYHREWESACERERAGDVGRPEYQAAALEERRLRVAAEAERDQAKKDSHADLAKGAKILLMFEESEAEVARLRRELEICTTAFRDWQAKRPVEREVFDRIMGTEAKQAKP